MSAETTDFAGAGFATIRGALLDADIAEMESAFPNLPARTAGARAEAFSPQAQTWFAEHEGLRELARRLLRAPARLSRMQAFDKSVGSNWFVPWHQDRAENGEDRSIAALERTTALRIHLDDCGADNGPLVVIPGSHLNGRLDAAAIAAMTAKAEPRHCWARRGDIVAMRPLLVHCSQRARKPAARRVIHLEYSAES
jgi:hypothetical protein